MSSRVTTSANTVLGLADELNAIDGIRQYEDIAVRLGTNVTLHKDVQRRLIQTFTNNNDNYQKKSEREDDEKGGRRGTGMMNVRKMHPYWDVGRYVRNFESGITLAWERYLTGLDPIDLYVVEKKQYNDDENLEMENGIGNNGKDKEVIPDKDVCGDNKLY